LVYLICGLTAVSTPTGCVVPTGDGYAGVYGVVRDSEGKPVQDATVSLSPAPESGLNMRPDVCVTKNDGRFAVSITYYGIDKYAFVLRVEKAGFEAIERPINKMDAPEMRSGGATIILSEKSKGRQSNGRRAGERERKTGPSRVGEP
jgi:hypothetical protein